MDSLQTWRHGLLTASLRFRNVLPLRGCAFCMPPGRSCNTSKASDLQCMYVLWRSNERRHFYPISHPFSYFPIVPNSLLEAAIHRCRHCKCAHATQSQKGWNDRTPTRLVCSNKGGDWPILLQVTSLASGT